MAKVPVEIIDLRNDKHPELDLAINEANRVQVSFKYTSLKSQAYNRLELSALNNTDADKFLSHFYEIKESQPGYHPYIIGILDGCIYRGDKSLKMMSARESENGIAILSNHGIRDVIFLPEKMTAFYLYEFAMHTLSFLSSGREHHKEIRQCVYDYKENPDHLRESMEAGQLCDDCLEWFRDQATSLSSRQLESFRKLLKRSKDVLGDDAGPAIGDTPRIFIGSSSEGLDYANAIQSNLSSDFFVDVWNNKETFGLGDTPMESLISALDEYDFGIFIFTPDDAITKRDENGYAPRDNVIFETGLFIGNFGRNRVFMITPRNRAVLTPSDLVGVSLAEYQPEQPNKGSAVNPLCTSIRQKIDMIQNM